MRDPNTRNTKSADQLLKKHVPKPSALPRLGKNPFGFDEGFYVYTGRHSEGGEQEYALDIVLDIKYGAGGSVVEGTLMAFQMLCPKCSMGLLVQDRAFGGQHELIVHPEKMHESQIEPGVLRPLVSALGNAISCDYSMAEVNGIVQPRNNIHVKCGWRGRLEYGKLLDDYLR